MSKYLLLLTGLGGFQKSYVIFGGGTSKYLLFLTGVGGWSGKGQKHPCDFTKMETLRAWPSGDGL